MTFAADLGHHLRSNGFTNVFVGYRPPEPDQLIALLDTPAPAPDTSFPMSPQRAQVTVRAAAFEYLIAANLAKRVFVQLHAYPSLASTEVSPPAAFVAVRALQTPYLLEYDDHDRPVFSFNFEANYTY